MKEKSRKFTEQDLREVAEALRNMDSEADSADKNSQLSGGDVLRAGFWLKRLHKDDIGRLLA